jgi:hypothetical protein
MKRSLLYLSLLAALLLPAGAVLADAAKKDCIVAQVADGLILGGVVDGDYVDSEEAVEPLQGGEKYQICSLTKKWAEATGNKPKYIEDEGGYYDSYLLKLSPQPDTKDPAYALSAPWNAQPRVAKVIKPADAPAAYSDDLRRLLQEKGITDPKIKLTQVLQVDLENDGTPEVLVSATNDRPNRLSALPEKGDYTVVVLRKTVGPITKTLLVDGCFYTKGGEAERTAPEIYTIPALLDVDNDGKLEIFLRWQYYEGDGTDVYSVEGDKIEYLFGDGRSV